MASDSCIVVVVVVVVGSAAANKKLAASLVEFTGEDTPDMLIPNATAQTNITRIFYNRVPKCGSRSVMSVIEEVGKTNGFAWIMSTIFTQSWITPADQVSDP